MNEEILKGLLEENIIFIKGKLTNEIADYVQHSLFYFMQKGYPEIKIYITSSGGSVDIGLAIYDFLRHYPGGKIGIVQGYAKSMAVLVLQGCDIRKAMKHSVFLIHNLSQSDVKLEEIRTPEKINKLKEKMEKSQKKINRVIAKNSKLTEEEISKNFNAERYISPKEAKELGIIDEII